MKRNYLLISIACVASIGFMSFRSLSSADKLNIAEYAVSEIVASEFYRSTCEIGLHERFEKQFSDMFSKVEKVDAHFSEQNGFYYVVYGVSQKGERVVDFSKHQNTR